MPTPKGSQLAAFFHFKTYPATTLSGEVNGTVWGV